MGKQVGNYQDGVNKMFVQGLFEESSVARHRIGTIRKLDDGRVFVYSQDSGSGLAPGKLCMGVTGQSAGVISEVIKAAGSIGDDHVHVTMGTTTDFATANAYRDGFFWLDDAAAGGDMYKIRGHAAIATGTDGIINLYDRLRVAVTTSNTWSASKSPAKKAELWDADDIDGIPLGVPPIDVTASYYFWIQVKGPCVVLTDGTITLGAGVVPSNGVDGAVEDSVPATSLDPEIGTVISVSATTLYSMINLAIPGY